MRSSGTLLRSVSSMSLPSTSRVKSGIINGDDESLIKPMILKDVSKLTGYDLSVISRAAAGKYVATAHGVYPLKFFFNERPKDDVDASTHELIATLKSVIDAEDKRHPLSDEVITAEMVSEKCLLPHAQYLYKFCRLVAFLPDKQSRLARRSRTLRQ